MAKRRRQDLPELNVSPRKVAYIVEKAREFDAKADPIGTRADEDGGLEALESFRGDPVLEELRAAIDMLDEDEVVDLIALAWVGRGDFDRDTWMEARELALERHRRRSSSYLIGMPALGDYLEQGLTDLGYSLEGEVAY